MNQGMSNSEACRTVGVNRRTGSRWRFGRTVDAGDGHELYYAPIVTPVVVSARFLSEDERIVIADGLRAGRSRRTIADELGRHPSTISREVTRNRDPKSGEYRPWAAQQQTVRRRCRPKRRKLVGHDELRAVVQDRLDRRWSPEQIANTLRDDFAERGDMQITAESIYQEAYAPNSVITRLQPVLRTGRPHRQRSRGHRRERFVAPMVMINERPAAVANRSIPGHWEGDLIIGELNRSAIGTLVERTTRYTILVWLGRHRSAELLRDEMIEAFNRLPASLRGHSDFREGWGRHEPLPARPERPSIRSFVDQLDLAPDRRRSTSGDQPLVRLRQRHPARHHDDVDDHHNVDHHSDDHHHDPDNDDHHPDDYDRDVNDHHSNDHDRHVDDDVDRDHDLDDDVDHDARAGDHYHFGCPNRRRAGDPHHELGVADQRREVR